MKPQLVIALLLLCGCTFIVAGVYILLGTGWAFIALGAAAIALAFVIIRGIVYVPAA